MRKPSHEVKKYDTEDGKCVTQCNHIPVLNKDGLKMKLFVGSLHCRLQCKHNVSYDTDQNMVECSYIGDMADKAMDARDDAEASCQGND
jgi:hypothetical protein